MCIVIYHCDTIQGYISIRIWGNLQHKSKYNVLPHPPPPPPPPHSEKQYRSVIKSNTFELSRDIVCSCAFICGSYIIIAIKPDFCSSNECTFNLVCTLRVHHTCAPYVCTIRVHHTCAPYVCTIRVHHTCAPYVCMVSKLSWFMKLQRHAIEWWRNSNSYYRRNYPTREPFHISVAPFSLCTNRLNGVMHSIHRSESFHAIQFHTGHHYMSTFYYCFWQIYRNVSASSHDWKRQGSSYSRVAKLRQAI